MTRPELFCIYLRGPWTRASVVTWAISRLFIHLFISQNRLREDLSGRRDIVKEIISNWHNGLIGIILACATFKLFALRLSTILEILCFFQKIYYLIKLFRFYLNHANSRSVQGNIR